MALRLAFYGDDFTGSTDTLATLASAGHRTLLFPNLPTPADLAAAGRLDAVGIAGTARAMSPAEMERALPAVFRWLASTGAAIVHYKTCSTFDSSPRVGSIGCAAAIGRRELGGAFVPIVGGQPDLGRYCVFGNLFAAAGQGGAVYRLDRHPTMPHHPVTPMEEADLRLHLAKQGLRVVSFDSRMLEGAAPELERRLDALLADAPAAVLFDVAGPHHLPAIGRLLWSRAARGQLLVLGPSGVEQALLAHWPVPPGSPAGGSVSQAGPVEVTFVVSGSLSPVTREQVACAATAGFATVALDAGRLADGTAQAAYLDGLVGRIARLLREGRSVVAFTAAAGEPRPAARRSEAGDTERLGQRLARACGRLLGGVLDLVPLQRVGIAGGDTASLAVQALPIRALSFAYSLSPGVAVCRVHAPGRRLDGLEIMLKGGQMGPPDAFPLLRRGPRSSAAS